MFEKSQQTSMVFHDCEVSLIIYGFMAKTFKVLKIYVCLLDSVLSG